MIEDKLFALLRLGLWEDAISKDKDIECTLLSADEWHAVVGMACHHGLDGTVLEGIMKLPENKRPSEAIVRTLRHRASQTMSQHFYHNAVIRELAERFGKAGIKAVLLKGESVALFHRQPLRRACGDIDLWVGVDQYDKVCRLVDEWGIAKEEETEESVLHLHFRYRQIDVEVHRIAASMLDRGCDAAFQRWSHGELSHSGDGNWVTPQGAMLSAPVEGSTKIATPTTEFYSVYLFYHLFGHFLMLDIRLRQFLDWVRFLHCRRDDIDRDKLKRLLEEFHLLDEWKAMACFAVQHLGLPQEEMPFYDEDYTTKSNQIKRRIETECLTDKHHRLMASRPAPGLRRKLYSLWHFGIRNYLNIRRIFPRYARLELVRHFKERLGLR